MMRQQRLTEIPTAPINRQVCAFCMTELRAGIEPISHGQCVPCYARELSRVGPITVVVTGCRNYTNLARIMSAFARLALPGADVTLVHGEQRGADLLAAEAARGLGWTVRGMQAEWGRFRKGAGPKRNAAMLREGPHVVVAFHDDIARSRGTRDCMLQAERLRIPTWLVDKPVMPVREAR